nr:glycosyltransferase [Streptoalloteichus tenebrarius]
MRVLFSSLDSYGHLCPLVPLALAASEAGHEVVFATAETRHAALRSVGLRPVAAGPSVEETFHFFARQSYGVTEGLRSGELSEHQRNDLIAFVTGSFLPRRLTEQLLPVIADFAPDLVVWECYNFGAAFAAKLSGTPSLCHGICRITSFDLHDHIVSAARNTGVELLGPDWAPDWGHSLGDRLLDIFPPSLQGLDFLAAEYRLELRPESAEAANPGDPVAAWAGTRPRPLVYLTMGTVFGSEQVLRQAVRGLGELEVDVLVATGPKVRLDTFGSVPENVRLTSWIPQSAVLPHADLVVHHGGSGTTLGSVAGRCAATVPAPGRRPFRQRRRRVGGGRGATSVGRGPDSRNDRGRGTGAAGRRGCPPRGGPRGRGDREDAVGQGDRRAARRPRAVMSPHPAG